jgi:hypothetical protein
MTTIPKFIAPFQIALAMCIHPDTEFTTVAKRLLARDGSSERSKYALV